MRMHQPASQCVAIAAMCAIALLGPFPSSWGLSQGDPTESLLARWAFDEGEGEMAFDETNYGSDGRIHSAVWVRRGDGYALSFGGEESCVVVGDSNHLVPQDRISICAWVNVTDITDGYHCILAKDGYRSGYRLLIDSTSMRVLFQLSGQEGGNLRSSTKLAFGEWQHVAATYDVKTMRIFVDGKRDPNEMHRNGRIDETSASLTIGRAHYQLFGMVDDVRIYGRALSDMEVSSLYESTCED